MLGPGLHMVRAHLACGVSSWLQPRSASCVVACAGAAACSEFVDCFAAVAWGADVACAAAAGTGADADDASCIWRVSMAKRVQPLACIFVIFAALALSISLSARPGECEHRSLTFASVKSFRKP